MRVRVLLYGKKTPARVIAIDASPEELRYAVATVLDDTILDRWVPRWREVVPANIVRGEN